MSARFHGPLLVGPGSLLLFVGVVPAGGTLSSTAAVPAFPPGIESAAVVLQAAFVGASGAGYFSDPSRLVMLSAQF